MGFVKWVGDFLGVIKVCCFWGAWLGDRRGFATLKASTEEESNMPRMGRIILPITHSMSYKAP
jgi:hypothetical protein